MSDVCPSSAIVGCGCVLGGGILLTAWRWRWSRTGSGRGALIVGPRSVDCSVERALLKSPVAGRLCVSRNLVYRMLSLDEPSTHRSRPAVVQAGSALGLDDGDT